MLAYIAYMDPMGMHVCVGHEPLAIAISWLKFTWNKSRVCRDSLTYTGTHTQIYVYIYITGKVQRHTKLTYPVYTPFNAYIRYIYNCIIYIYIYAIYIYTLYIYIYYIQYIGLFFISRRTCTSGQPWV